MTTIFLSFVKQKWSLLKSRPTRSQKAQNSITIYVGMRPTSGIEKRREKDHMEKVLQAIREELGSAGGRLTCAGSQFNFFLHKASFFRHLAVLKSCRTIGVSPRRKEKSSNWGAKPECPWYLVFRCQNGVYLVTAEPSKSQRMLCNQGTPKNVRLERVTFLDSDGDSILVSRQKQIESWDEVW